ncbi:Pyruvate phosphate dikinase [Desulfamplus magnetovallimortis]|uniref:Pyruvate phosphate dikinase n=1 Tax=Desulfamplus magnetovallimortis TaxID=1246637 RepID=A0A1W1HJB9_9BACT|nr:PEP/pyruvate-binding domain-containing protein [Desulfamplus magnetovallimortis]SLM32569.1 Pyruvate phosphate dikinase [Desulfamplus magnetovallimortis]
METSVPEPIESDALKANLRETAQQVVIKQEYQLLLEVVSRYRGIHNNLEKLLFELCHSFRNWSLILPQIRSFLLKNCHIYNKNEKASQAFRLFASIFLQAIKESEKSDLILSQALEALFAWLDKLISLSSSSDKVLSRYEAVLNELFVELGRLDVEDKGSRAMMQMVQGHHSMRKVISRILALESDINYIPVNSLMASVLAKTYQYWLKEEDPCLWIRQQSDVAIKVPENLFDSISHKAMTDNLKSLEAIKIDGDAEDALKSGIEALKALLLLPAHVDIVRQYKAIPEQLTLQISQLPDDSGSESSPDYRKHLAENVKLRFMFKIMDTGGLHLIHEDTLREINHSLVKLIRQQRFEDIENFLLTTFKLLKANVKRYPHTSLNCIQVLGDEVFKRENSRMVETFLWEAVRFGFQQASVAGVDEEWQPITNPAHLTNIRVWLHLITQEPKWCATLFSALIINIKLAGTCVKDTDLFQRDITNLLNHPIEPVYNLVKQFTKLMPVFFNQIGAEGELRYVSTELDEVHKRKDRLIHFLRKQAHVESSNLVVEFMQEIFTFWLTKKKEPLSGYVPQETFDEIEVTGPFIDEVHEIALKMKRELNICSMDDTLALSRKRLKQFFEAQKSISIEERLRFDRILHMYRLVHQKYHLSFQDLKSEFAQAERDGFTGMMELMDMLETGSTETCLDALLTQLENLKDVILSEEKYTARESIHHKRHIAVDIPSMYGSYQERKFDSLSLTFRLENLAVTYLEKLPERVNLSFITQATFFRIAASLKRYLRALAIDGINSRRLNTYMSLLDSSLKIRRFSYTQYMDIFRGFSEGVKDVIYAYYTNIHQNNLSIIIPRIGGANLVPRYKSAWDEDDMLNTTHSLSEAFFRDLIASTFGLQHLDTFITKIIQTLEQQKSLLNQNLLDLLMTYNPEKSISMLHDYNPYTHDLIHLSNKGFNLVTMTRDNLPVPPAFIITTEIFRCREVVYAFSKAKEEFMGRIREALNRIQGITGKLFGFTENEFAENPLLLSVRSGSALSMPGMMATIHNVGLNEEIIEEYVANHGNAYLAWDNYRRFIQSWAMISGKVNREDFQKLMDAAKEMHNVKLKWEFSPDQMRTLALSYYDLVHEKGLEIPYDPWLQLVGAIEMVLDSWENSKATDYRKVMDLSDAWGTAVIVQTMVYGNISRNSGSGVFFTSHPYRKVQRVALWGDYAYGDQGEDIVSGLVTSYPISIEQAEIDGRSREKSLEIRFPKIYDRLLSIARELVYHKKWNPQEMEFTFEGPEPDDLYLLQTRDMITIKKKEQFDVFIETEYLYSAFLGKGIGVSGSALSGIAVFSEENIKSLKKSFARGEIQPSPLILIRQDTVPEDIKVINMAEALLTSRGGQTSHASVVAVRLEKTCVVGCRDMKVYESRQYCDIGDHRIAFGDAVSIDGRNGRIFKGRHGIKNEKHILPI